MGTIMQNLEVEWSPIISSEQHMLQLFKAQHESTRLNTDLWALSIFWCLAGPCVSLQHGGK